MIEGNEHIWVNEERDKVKLVSGLLYPGFKVIKKESNYNSTPILDLLNLLLSLLKVL